MVSVSNFVFPSVLVAAVFADTSGIRELMARQNPLVDGAKSSMVNSQQVWDTLVRQLQSGGGHGAADTIAATITGLDSQIDNSIATVSSALAPLSGGLSMAVGNFLLGPFVQSVTNGAEVVLSNVVGGVIDGATAPVAQALSGNISKLVQQANKYNVDTTRLESLNKAIVESLPSGSHHRRGDDLLVTRQNAFVDGAKSSVENSQQVFDTLTRQMQSGSYHGAADTMAAAITGLDSQIDISIATVSNALAPLTGGMSMAVGNFLLGPFVQSVTNGAEVVLSNVVGGAIDAASAPVAQAFTSSVSKLVQEAGKYNIDTARLGKLNDAIQNHIAKDPSTKSGDAKHARGAPTQDPLVAGAKSSVTNSQQVIDTLTRQLQSNSLHGSADSLTAVITGLDSQIDNTIGTVANVLDPITGGASMAVGDFLLGPFVQSVTNGAEVLLSNVVGGAIDGVSAPVLAAFTGNIAKLTQQAAKYNVNTVKLVNLNKQLQQHVGKH